MAPKDRPGHGGGYSPTVATLRLFAAAREAAGTGRTVIDGATVGEVLDRACATFGDGFAGVLSTARVWRNGEPAEVTEPVAAADEVAVLPPISGGAG